MGGFVENLEKNYTKYSHNSEHPNNGACTVFDLFLGANGTKSGCVSEDILFPSSFGMDWYDLNSPCCDFQCFVFDYQEGKMG